MKLTIELDREVDGRWIAEVPELNVLLYGDSKQDAIQRAQSAAREIVLDRIAHGELPPDSANAVFDIDAPSPKAKSSCGDIEHGIGGIRRQLTVGDAVENNLPRGGLSSLNRVLPRVPVQEDVQFRYLGNPTPVDFAIELDRELHSHSLAPMASVSVSPQEII